MPRRPNIDRPVRLELKMRESIRSKVDLYLFSEVEQRVPKGKYQEFFEERTVAFFNNAKLDLTPFGFPEGFYIEAPKEMLPLILERMKKNGG